MNPSLLFSKSSAWLCLGTICGLIFILTGHSPYLGFLFFYVLSGLPVAMLFFGATVELTSMLVASSTVSIILLYPAAVLVALLEGTDGAAIYQSHLELDALVVIGLNLVFTLIALYRRPKKISYDLSWFNKKHLVLIIFAGIFLLINLNRADMMTDEVDLGYRAYDLVDGMVAGRKAYTLSFYDHTPLALHANHFGFQLLEHKGFRYLEDWMARFPSAIIAFLSFLIWGLVFFKRLPRRQAWASWLLLAVLTPFLFSGRIFLREIFITFFLGGWFFFLEDWLLSSIMLGAILLVKSTNFPLVIVGLIAQLYWQPGQIKTRLSLLLKSSIVVLLMFTPIIIYNAAAYMLTGYMDILFSRIFNIYHQAGYTGERAHRGTIMPNFFNLLRVQADQVSIPAFILLLTGLFKSLKQPNNKFLCISAIILIVMFMFYWLVGFRSYYLVYLAPIMAMMIALSYANLKITTTIILTSLLVVYMTFYSWNTLINDRYEQSLAFDDSGRSGPIYLSPPLNLSRLYSITIRAWSERRGWKDLKAKIDSFGIEKPILILDHDLDGMKLRKYLGVKLSVNRFYLGDKADEWYEAYYDNENHPNDPARMIWVYNDFTVSRSPKL